MISLESQKDSSYFYVQTDVPAIGKGIRRQDVLGLSVVEEGEALTTGTIKLLDPLNIYDRILHRNVDLTIQWGYKRTGADPLASAMDGQVMSAAVDRRGYHAVIQGVSGGADENGLQTFNANFICPDFIGLSQSRLFSKVTRQAVIQQVLLDCGILPANQDVRFVGMTTSVPDDGERQDENGFRYLARKSSEWHAIFRIGYDAGGVACGIFLSPDFLSTSAVARRMTGGATLALRYKAGSSSNVLSYSWKQEEGENGAGANIRIVMLNGQATFQAMQVQDESVTVWEFDATKLREFFGPDKTMDQMMAEVKAIMASADFTSPTIRKYWKPVLQSTAPNGLGYVINARVFGSPFSTPPMVASFEQGFPSCLTNRAANAALRAQDGEIGAAGAGPVRKNLYYLRKVNHDLSDAGYYCDLEIVDSYLALGAVGLQ